MTVPLSLGFLDRTIFTAAAGGTGAFTFASAVSGFQSPVAAGVVNGGQYGYAAQSADLSQWEYGFGTWTAATKTLSRTVLGNNLNTTSPINFLAPPNVNITLLAESMTQVAAASVNTFYVSNTGNDSNSGTSPSQAWQTVAKVNAQVFTPGSTILFKGGQTFTGGLVLASSGVPGRPITYGSYGNVGSRATISPPNNVDGFLASNFDNFCVQDLIFVGSNPTGATKATGCEALYNSGGEWANIVFQNLDISNFPGRGIFVDGGFFGASPGALVYGVRVSNCHIHGLGGSTFVGVNPTTFIEMRGFYTSQVSGRYNLINPIVENCRCHDITFNNGNNSEGILLSECDGALIFNCELYNMLTSAESFGIGFYDAINSTVKQCHAHDDGSTHQVIGLSLEASINSVIEDCLAANMSGVGTEIYGYNFGQVQSCINCVFRNNTLFNCGINDGDHANVWISNDGLAGSPNAQVTGVQVYGNTVITGASNQVALLTGGSGDNDAATTALIKDNRLIAGVMGSTLVKGVVAAGVALDGNSYHYNGMFKATWAGTTYTDLGSYLIASGNEPSFRGWGLTPVGAGNTKTIYVRTTGSDTTGSGTLAAPFLTTQHAVNFIAANFDFASGNIVLNVGAGSFAGFGMPSTVGGGVMQLQGAASGSTTITDGPNDGVLNDGSGISCLVPCGTLIALNAVTFNNTTGVNGGGPNNIHITANGITMWLGDYLNLSLGGNSGDLIFTHGADSGYALFIEADAKIQTVGFSPLTATFVCTHNPAGFMTVDKDGIFFDTWGWTVTGTKSILVAFAVLARIGLYVSRLASYTQTGTLSGFQVQVAAGGQAANNQSIINRLGINYFPGTQFAFQADAFGIYDGYFIPLPPNVQTSSYVLGIADLTNIVEMNLSGAGTVTIPNNATVPFPIGSEVPVVSVGTTAPTVALGSGVTLDNSSALTRYNKVLFYKRGTNEWVQTV